jgi:hypothetical protein
VVQLKGPYRTASFGRTTWPRRAPASTPTTRWGKSARPKLCEKRWRCHAASTGLFSDPSCGKISGIYFATLAEAARRLSAVGNLVLTAPAQGVIMAASARTPTSAITRLMLQASTLIAISVDALRRLRIRKCVAPFQHTRIVRLPHDLQVVKWLTIEYEDP